MLTQDVFLQKVLMG